MVLESGGNSSCPVRLADAHNELDLVTSGHSLPPLQPTNQGIARKLGVVPLRARANYTLVSEIDDYRQRNGPDQVEDGSGPWVWG